jgi:hypothetical protein
MNQPLKTILAVRAYGLGSKEEGSKEVERMKKGSKGNK